jgi:hypothetical protein
MNTVNLYESEVLKYLHLLGGGKSEEIFQSMRISERNNFRLGKANRIVTPPL